MDLNYMDNFNTYLDPIMLIVYLVMIYWYKIASLLL